MWREKVQIEMRQKKGIDMDEREESWSCLKVTNPKAFNSIVLTINFNLYS